jgi:hypothetical protein
MRSRAFAELQRLFVLFRKTTVVSVGETAGFASAALTERRAIALAYALRWSSKIVLVDNEQLSRAVAISPTTLVMDRETILKETALLGYIDTLISFGAPDEQLVARSRHHIVDLYSNLDAAGAFARDGDFDIAVDLRTGITAIQPDHRYVHVPAYAKPTSNDAGRMGGHFGILVSNFSDPVPRVLRNILRPIAHTHILLPHQVKAFASYEEAIRYVRSIGVLITLDDADHRFMLLRRAANDLQVPVFSMQGWLRGHRFGMRATELPPLFRATMKAVLGRKMSSTRARDLWDENPRLWKMLRS